MSELNSTTTKDPLCHQKKGRSSKNGCRKGDFKGEGSEVERQRYRRKATEENEGVRMVEGRENTNYKGRGE